MYEEGANLCCIRRWIEPSGIARSMMMVAAVERLAPAPATAADKRAVRGFQNEITAVRDQLRVGRKHRGQRLLALAFTVFML